MGGAGVNEYIHTYTHMYKMHAPSKYAKGTYIWLGTAPCLMRGDPFKCLGGQWFRRNTIVDRASAQNLLESTRMVRTPSISVQFSLSIELWSVGCCQLMLDAFFGQVRGEFSGGIFTSIV